MPNQTLRTLPHPSCPACDGAGRVLHAALEDRLFGVPGKWRMRRCEVAGCGTAWLDPAPHPDDLWMAYREYYTHEDDATPRVPGSLGQQAWAAWKLGYPRPAGITAWLAGLAMLLQPRRRERALSTRLHLPFVAGGRFLDVGCGSGRQLQAMRLLGWEVQGLDMDAAAVARVRQLGLEVRQGDLLAASFAPASFDAASLLHVIEHLAEPARQLAECRRILRTGGWLVLVAPNIDALGHRWFGPDWRGLEPPRHLQLHSLAALTQAVRDAGFAIEHATTRSAGAARMLRLSASLRRARRQGLARASGRGSRLGDLRWRLLGSLERALVAAGLPLGEELVVVARKRRD